jgi:hypothetical protein
LLLFSYVEDPMRLILFALVIAAVGCHRGNSQTTAPRTNTQEAALDPSQQNPNGRQLPVGSPNDPSAPSTDPIPPPPDPVPPTVPPPPDPDEPYDPLDDDAHPLPPMGPDTP